MTETNSSVRGLINKALEEKEHRATLARLSAIKLASEFDAQQSGTGFPLIATMAVGFIAFLIGVIAFAHPMIPSGIGNGIVPVEQDAGTDTSEELIPPLTSKRATVVACQSLRQSLCSKMIMCGQWTLNESKMSVRVDEADASNYVKGHVSSKNLTSISVSSSPSGAEVFLGVFDTGEKTPLVDYQLDPGTYTIRVVARNGAEDSREITIENDQTGSLHLYPKRPLSRLSSMDRCLASLDDSKFCGTEDTHIPTPEAVIMCGQGIEMMSCDDSFPVGCRNL